MIIIEPPFTESRGVQGNGRYEGSEEFGGESAWVNIVLLVKMIHRDA